MHTENCRCPVCHSQRSGQTSVQLTVRLLPDIKAKIMSHPQGARSYLETLVKEAPALHGKLQIERIINLQTRQAHNQLKARYKILKARYQQAQEALRQLTVPATAPAPLS